MAEKYQVVGPPGCGKTTYVKGQVERAVAAFGGREVMICSLTRAAAAEVRGRKVPVPDQNVGTLHSFAYRALGCPELAETKLKEWNEAFPKMALSPSKGISAPEDDREDDAGQGGEAPGDECHEQMNLLRHWQRDRVLWPVKVRSFAEAWEGWLEETGRVDFTGLIEQAAANCDYAPCRPLALFVDEAQDLSRLEVSLIAKWSAECSKVVLVGDPAQALYEWRAAEPEGFYGVGDANHRRILAQSYRVPQMAHAAATRWGRTLLEGIEYRPTEQRGSLDQGRTSMRYADGVADMVEEHLGDSESGSLMLQALCSYMLRPLISVLRKRGVPFHNPQRTHRGDWNPLGARKGTSTVDRLLAFVTDEQSADTARSWLPMLASKGVLKTGAKEALKGDLGEREIIDLFVSQDVAERAFSGDLEWLLDHAAKEFRERLAYPLSVLKIRGADALKSAPRVMVGTFHSFKGGEADHVVVAPDLSPAAYREHYTTKGLGVRRAFYVALTRTRDRLTVLQPSDPRSVQLL